MALNDEFNKLSNIFLENAVMFPNTRKGVLHIEDLQQHSGWFSKVLCDTNKDKMDDIELQNIFHGSSNELYFNTYNTLNNEDKLKVLEKNHYKSQEIIGDIIKKYVLISKENKNKNQSQMGKLCFDYYDSKEYGRGYLTMTLNTIAEQYGLIKPYYEGKNKKINVIKTDFEYKPIIYVEKNDYPSKYEAKCAKILFNNNINFEIQKRFVDCINPHTNKMLPFDFYCEEYNLLHHFK